MSPQACSVTDTADGYTLRCILLAGHEGDHLADTIEETADAS